MRRESHVRFREGLGVKFPRATNPQFYWGSWRHSFKHLYLSLIHI